MRKLILFLAAIGVNAGFASQVPNPLLSLQANSGYVPPHMAWSKSCKVYGARVQLVTRKANQNPVTKVRALIFTKEVANLNQIVRLSAEARRGKILQRSAPTDGPSSHYQAIQTVGAGAPSPVELKHYYSGVYKENVSLAAKRLVRLLDLNCK